MPQGMSAFVRWMSAVTQTERHRDGHPLGRRDRSTDLSRECSETVGHTFVEDRCTPGFAGDDYVRAAGRLFELDAQSLAGLALLQGSVEHATE